jgi:U3 small nucleolar RNA-associated protein 14
MLENPEPRAEAEAEKKEEFSEEQLQAAGAEVAHLIPANPWVAAVKEVAVPSAATKRRKKDTEPALTMPKTILEESEILKNFQDDVDEEQRELIRTLFVQSEERQENAEDKLANNAPVSESLPGWGRWVGAGATKRSRRGGKAHKDQSAVVGKKPATPVATGKAVTTKTRVSRVKVMNVAPPAEVKVPHNFKDADEYRKFRAMDTTAPELLSVSAHARVVAPRVNLRLGAVVPPLQSGKQLTVGQRDILIDAWNNKRRPTRTKAKF